MNYTIYDYTTIPSLPKDIVCIPQKIFENKEFATNIVYSDLFQTIINRTAILFFITSVVLFIFLIQLSKYLKKYKYNDFNTTESCTLITFIMLFMSVSTMITYIVVLSAKGNLTLIITTIVLYLFVYSCLFYHFILFGVSVGNKLIEVWKKWQKKKVKN